MSGELPEPGRSASACSAAGGTGCASRGGRRMLMALAVLVVLSLQTGCVYRRMTIRSDPPDALVIVDGEEIGHTPVSMDFTYYGTREIMLVKDGYETLTVLQRVPAPWYQILPFEFVADNFAFRRITNRHEFNYRLQPQVVVPTQELLDRANAVRSETQTGGP